MTSVRAPEESPTSAHRKNRPQPGAPPRPGQVLAGKPEGYNIRGLQLDKWVVPAAQGQDPHFRSPAALQTPRTSFVVASDNRVWKRATPISCLPSLTTMAFLARLYSSDTSRP